MQHAIACGRHFLSGERLSLLLQMFLYELGNMPQAFFKQKLLADVGLVYRKKYGSVEGVLFARK